MTLLVHEDIIRLTIKGDFVIHALLLIMSVSFAKEPSTLVCYDGKEKLIEMTVKSAKIVSKKQTEVVDEQGNPFTILNLSCSLK